MPSNPSVIGSSQRLAMGTGKSDSQSLRGTPETHFTPSFLPNAPVRGITKTDSPYERGQFGGRVRSKESFGEASGRRPKWQASIAAMTKIGCAEYLRLRAASPAVLPIIQIQGRRSGLVWGGRLGWRSNPPSTGPRRVLSARHPGHHSSALVLSELLIGTSTASRPAPSTRGMSAAFWLMSAPCSLS
jgi:hypothetical protein